MVRLPDRVLSTAITVESHFLEPPREMEIGSLKSRRWHKITLDLRGIVL